MQTVESLIRELQRFPPDARCYAYEGEGVTREDGTHCHAYVVIVTPQPETFPNGGVGHRELGVIPCAEGVQDDGGAIKAAPEDTP